MLMDLKLSYNKFGLFNNFRNYKNLGNLVLFRKEVIAKELNTYILLLFKTPMFGKTYSGAIYILV